MSLPTQTTTPTQYSSSPQHASRGFSGPKTLSRPQSFDRPPTAQRISHSPEQQTTYDVAGDTYSLQPGDDDHHETSSVPHLSFQPFFTLIEDANTSEYHHPAVHYIFSDDDTDIVTEAALRALDMEPDISPDLSKGKAKSGNNQLPTRQPNAVGNGTAGPEDDEPPSPKKEPLLPPPIPGVRDNYIILDMELANPDEAKHFSSGPARAAGTAGMRSVSTSPAAQGTLLHQQSPSGPHGLPQTQPQFKVVSAHSLTPAWQVLSTQVVPAPTFENNPSGEQPSIGDLMLKIRGTSGLPVTMFGKDRDKDRGSQRLEDMMEQFGKRLGELRQVIEAGQQVQPTQDALFGGEEVLGGVDANAVLVPSPHEQMDGHSNTKAETNDDSNI
ncbi:hypothetical protein KXV92_000606 [Aspergillus fumigatus]|nr:hypothetical protein KXX42_009518 [Aspergillus fumigatus]KAH1982203.1 hypothetical protein KXW88_004886 [Aspergillus fumigatus]KAH2751230.1 hypothetical protein KXV94_002543 [Aspergillus fumigatus]KAH3197511.1 hypothetical protein KXW62_002377 [Aspergillus fumigatus]KAH3197749.1 hypothetical protein KXV92_000606 [Aspergillus fumigatus]